MTTKHTQGPWFADEEGRIWRRPLSELYERGGTVAGDKPIAVVFKGWHGKNEVGFPVEANASLIAAAPQLLEALQTLTDRIAYYASLAEGEAPNIEQWAYTDGSSDVAKARSAIAKATGQPND